MFSATASAALGQLSGLAGVGKSLVAEEYALRFGGAYPGGVFWLRAFGNDGNNQPTAGYSALADQTASIAVALGIHVEGLSHEQVSAALVRTLDRAARPFLWIVDDLPNGLAAADVQSWRAPGRFGKTLITTRSREYDATGSLLRLDVLPAGDAYQLLTKRRPIERNDERAVAMMLATDLLGGHPLALDVASAAVEYYESYAAFMQALAHPSADALDLAKEYVGELPNGHEKSIVATFLTSLARLGPAGTDFIRLSSVLATAPLDLDLTAMIFAADDYAELDEEVDLDKARAKVRSAFRQVDKLSLAEDVNGPVPARSVHGLVSRVVRRDRAPANVERLAKLRIAALTIFTHTLKLTADMRSHPQIEAHVAHARKMVTEEDDEFAAELLGWVGRYDAARADTSTALQAFRRQWALRTRFLGPEHPDTLTAMGNVAWMLSVRGDLANSRRMKEEVLGLCRKSLLRSPRECSVRKPRNAWGPGPTSPRSLRQRGTLWKPRLSERRSWSSAGKCSALIIRTHSSR